MTPYDRFELKFASALIGLLELWMAAVVGLSNGRDPLSVALRWHDLHGACSLVMAGLGAMILLGAVRPMRALRHWGLAGTFIVSSYLMVITVAERGLLGMTAGAVMLLLTGSFVLLGADAVKGQEHREGR